MCVTGMKDATITVRVLRKLKGELAKYGVKVSEVLRKALEEEVRKERREEFRAATAELRELFSRVPDDEIS